MLAHEPSSEVRGMLASKLAADYRSNNFSKSEEKLAIDIFHLLLKDADVTIRTSMSEQLAHCAKAPRDIVLQLSRDIAAVSVPILEHSTVLSEDDLIEIVKSTKEVIKLCAIARRDSISEELSGSLIESSNVIVLQNLFKNRGAAITASQFLSALEFANDSNNLMETLVERGGLPLTVAEKIYSSATDEIRYSLSRQYKLNKTYVSEIANDAREWALLGLAPIGDHVNPRDDEQAQDLIDELHTNDRLSHSLLMRALCAGNMSIFECGIAKLANVPRINARILLMEGSGMGFKGIYAAANMPEGFCEAVKVLLRISLEETDFGRTHREDFRKRVIERIYMGKYNRTVENMEYLLSIIGGRIAASADAH